jgi:hypothetical protein
MNLLKGDLNERGAWQCGDLEIPVPDIVQNRMRVGWSLILGIRPEHGRLAVPEALPSPVKITGPTAPDEPPTFVGRVVHIERDLPRRVQTLFIEHDLLPTIGVTVSSDIWVRPTDQIPILLPSDNLAFFDGKTEMRIA